jgi:hypothetical protein
VGVRICHKNIFAAKIEEAIVPINMYLAEGLQKKSSAINIEKESLCLIR